MKVCDIRTLQATRPRDRSAVMLSAKQLSKGLKEHRVVVCVSPFTAARSLLASASGVSSLTELNNFMGSHKGPNTRLLPTGPLVLVKATLYGEGTCWPWALLLAAR